MRSRTWAGAAFVTAGFFLPATTLAGLGATAGGARDWIKVEKNGDWKEVTAPSPALSWDVPMWGGEGDEADKGLSFSTRFLRDSVEGMSGAGSLTEYAIDYWNVRTYFEWFARTLFETWDKELVGEFSGAVGAGGGARFPVIGDSTFEASLHWSRSVWGLDNGTHWGLYFGLRLTEDGSGDEPKAEGTTPAGPDTTVPQAPDPKAQP
jgi:hypothetical protein